MLLHGKFIQHWESNPAKNGLLADCVNQSLSSAHAEDWSAVAIGVGSGFCHFVKFTPYNYFILPYNKQSCFKWSFCWLVGWLFLKCFFFLFIVRVAPQITTQPQVGSVIEGDNVTLSCNASGNPEPTISWRRDGSLVSSGDQRISFEAGNRQLTITNVNRADSGEYLCVADNSEGNDTSNAITLDVKCKYTSSVQTRSEYTRVA